MMRIMKINFRDAICLGNSEYMDNFNDALPECQVYALLCTCCRKNEEMLNYLWETYGTYVWN